MLKRFVSFLLKFGLVGLVLLCLGYFLFFPVHEKEPIKVAANSWPGYEPLHLADAEGFWDESEVYLHESGSTSEAVLAYKNGLIDVVCLTMDEFLFTRESVTDSTVILVLDFSNGGDVVLSRPDIQWKEPTGQWRIGVENNALGGFMLSRFLDKHRLPIEHFKVVPLAFDQHVLGYTEDKIDLLVTFEPVASQLLNNGAVKVFDSTEIPREIVDVLVCRQELVERRSKDLSVLVKGWFEALKLVKSRSPRALAVMAERQRMSVDELKMILAKIEFPSLSENLRLIEGQELVPTVRMLHQVMMNASLLTKGDSLEGLFNSEVLKQQP